ncbi:MAG: hypothetical protein P8Y78_14030 [Acidihalobacter sp.]
MNFIETRGNDGQRPAQVSFSQAILSPMSSFGGIYVPERLPALDSEFLRAHLDSGYKALARDILTAFGLDIDAGLIDEALALYDGRAPSRTWPCSPLAWCSRRSPNSAASST